MRKRLREYTVLALFFGVTFVSILSTLGNAVSNVFTSVSSGLGDGGKPVIDQQYGLSKPYALPWRRSTTSQEERSGDNTTQRDDATSNSATYFRDYGINPRIDTGSDHLSTFAIDVDTGAYTLMRRYITEGILPPVEAIRAEEYINFFEQEYAPPAEGAFAIHLEGAPFPYATRESSYILRVGLKGYETPSELRPDAVLTFVIDISGSMNQHNRLELIKSALESMVNELRPTDQIGIVVYGTSAHSVIEHTPVRDRQMILGAIRNLSSEGSTNAEAGLILGYDQAARAFNPDAINRVILCSDGVANVGNTGPDAILAQIDQYADEGIYLTTIGFGMGDYNDFLMEQLADKGDGFYAYVDTPREAKRLFVHQLPSALQVIAKDAKIQVDFEPKIISSYRLIGYENREVADVDFRNDDVDAGEIGMGHSVTALYEVQFHPDAAEDNTALTVYMRYADPENGKVHEISTAVTKADFVQHFEDASPRFQLDTVVAQYAEVLGESYWAKQNNITLETIIPDTTRIAQALDRDKDVQEFAELVKAAATLMSADK